MPSDLSGTIVFSSGKHCDYDIWTLNLANGDVRQLTHGSFWNDKPRWSPNGHSIVFVSNASGTPDIYQVDAAGGGTAIPLIQNGAWNDYPCFSPDGTKLGFVSNVDGNNDLWIANPDGTEPSKITTHPGSDSFFGWTPDGRAVLFSSDRSGNQDIVRLDLATRQVTQLTTDAGADIHPATSPDGQFIAFVSNRQLAPDRQQSEWADRDHDIWLMRADGSSQVRLTDNQGSDRCVAWSPDGTALIYAASRVHSAAERLAIVDVQPVLEAMRANDESAVQKTAARLRHHGVKMDRDALEQDIGARRHTTFLTRLLPDAIARGLYDPHYFGSERFPDWHAVGAPQAALVNR